MTHAVNGAQWLDGLCWQLVFHDLPDTWRIVTKSLIWFLTKPKETWICLWCSSSVHQNIKNRLIAANSNSASYETLDSSSLSDEVCTSMNASGASWSEKSVEGITALMSRIKKSGKCEDKPLLIMMVFPSCTSSYQSIHFFIAMYV